MDNDCKKMHVPEDCCMLLFSDDEFKGSNLINKGDEFFTVRGELVLLHFERGTDRLVAIELISEDKPCQTGE